MAQVSWFVAPTVSTQKIYADFGEARFVTADKLLVAVSVRRQPQRVNPRVPSLVSAGPCHLAVTSMSRRCRIPVVALSAPLPQSHPRDDKDSLP